MSIKSLILENEFKMIVLNNRIDIVNFLDILSVDENGVVIKHKDGYIKVIGIDLSIKKFLDQELLLEGKIKKIEYMVKYEQD